MASTERTIQASPDEVWAVLADAMSYDRWVVGAKDIRTADGSWPAAGSKLHHTSGVGPLQLKDDTKVLESEGPRRIVLEARGRSLGRARIELLLEPEAQATRVTMIEQILRPAPAAPVLNLVLGPLVHSRNVETLRRLDEATHERVATERPGG